MLYLLEILLVVFLVIFVAKSASHADRHKVPAHPAHQIADKDQLVS